MPHLLFPPHGKAAKAERLRRMPQLCQNRSHLTAVFGGVIEYVAQHVFHPQLIVRAFDVAVLKRLIKPAISQGAKKIPPCLPQGIPRRPYFCERGKIRSSRQYRRVGSLQSLKPHPAQHRNRELSSHEATARKRGVPRNTPLARAPPNWERPAAKPTCCIQKACLRIERSSDSSFQIVVASPTQVQLLCTVTMYGI